MENWRDIHGQEGYQVSDLGRVRSIQRIVVRKDGRAMLVRGGIRKLHLVKVDGRPSSVRVTIRGRSNLVHHLVLKAFKGRCPKGHEGCHNDGKCTNNRLSNLRWDTRESNVADVYRHGSRKRDWAPSIARLQGRTFISGYLDGAMGFST